MDHQGQNDLGKDKEGQSHSYEMVFFFFVKNYLIYFYRRDLTWIYFGNNLKDKNTHINIYKHEHIIIIIILIIKKEIHNFFFLTMQSSLCRKSL